MLAYMLGYMLASVLVYASTLLAYGYPFGKAGGRLFGRPKADLLGGSGWAEGPQGNLKIIN